MKNTYIPGVCNIGPAEIRSRRNAGLIGLLLLAALLVLFAFYDVPPVFRLVVFFPATLAAIGYLQAVLHFCVKFGMSGLFNFSQSLEKTETVSQAEYRRKDQHKAITIIIGSVVSGLIITALSMFI